MDHMDYQELNLANIVQANILCTITLDPDLNFDYKTFITCDYFINRHMSKIFIRI